MFQDAKSIYVWSFVSNVIEMFSPLNYHQTFCLNYTEGAVNIQENVSKGYKVKVGANLSQLKALEITVGE